MTRSYGITLVLPLRVNTASLSVATTLSPQDIACTASLRAFRRISDHGLSRVGNLSGPHDAIPAASTRIRTSPLFLASSWKEMITILLLDSPHNTKRFSFFPKPHTEHWLSDLFIKIPSVQNNTPDSSLSRNRVCSLSLYLRTPSGPQRPALSRTSGDFIAYFTQDSVIDDDARPSARPSPADQRRLVPGLLRKRSSNR